MQESFKVCICGGATSIGQQLALLMATNSMVKELSVYDLEGGMVPAEGVATDLSHLEFPCRVKAYSLPVKAPLVLLFIYYHYDNSNELIIIITITIIASYICNRVLRAGEAGERLAGGLPRRLLARAGHRRCAAKAWAEPKGLGRELFIIIISFSLCLLLLLLLLLPPLYSYGYRYCHFTIITLLLLISFHCYFFLKGT